MTEKADQLHHDTVPAHSTALVQVFLAMHHITQVCQLHYSPDLAPCNNLAFPKAKIGIESEEICECNGHTVHKLSQRRLTADWLAPQESDCSWMHSKVSSDGLPSYIKATWLVLEIFKMAGYFLDRPHIKLHYKRSYMLRHFCTIFRELWYCVWLSYQLLRLLQT